VKGEKARDLLSETELVKDGRQSGPTSDLERTETKLYNQAKMMQKGLV